MNTSPLRHTRGLLLMIALAASAAALDGQLRQRGAVWVEPPQESLIRWHPRVFRVLSFGHLPAAIDWIWIRAMGDPSIFHVPRGTHPPTYYDLDLASDLDPAFAELYVSGANYLAVIRDDIEGARSLLEKGARFVQRDLPGYPESFREREWRQAWAVYMNLAYVHLFELGQLPQAAEAFLEGSKLPNAPAFLRSLGRRIAEPGGVYEVGIRLLNYMHDGEKDPRVRLELSKKRDSLYLSQFLFQLNLSFQAYLNGLPYYRARTDVSYALLKDYFATYLKKTGTADRDPWGGRLFLSPSGRIDSTTPRQKVYGLD